MKMGQSDRMDGDASLKKFLVSKQSKCQHLLRGGRDIVEGVGYKTASFKFEKAKFNVNVSAPKKWMGWGEHIKGCEHKSFVYPAKNK